MTLPATPSQTFGPFFHIGCKDIVTDFGKVKVTGERVVLEGRVLDGDGKPVNDASVEIWQANAHGKFAHPEDTQNKPLDPGFSGFTRVATDDAGRFRVTTIKPGRVPGPGGVLQAPHLAVIVGMRGLLKHLFTRIYFPDEASNADDPILQRVPSDRRGTLIAKPTAPQTLEWNAILQGKDETVFFDY